jgi:MoxR-like ATPase
MHEIAFREKIAEAIAHVAHGLVERETQARLLVLSALCGEHILFIGPPGTAKSELARRLNAVVGGAFFERLLTRFTVPEELFGPLSLAALDEGRYERDINGYLPTASVAFLDEVFKANSAILNALLGVLNERRFDQGPLRIEVPLVSLVGASNEIPAEEALQAFHDRFLFRCPVEPVSDNGFARLLETEICCAAVTHQLTPSNLSAAQSAAGTIAISDAVRDALLQLREFARGHGIGISDRRWVRIVRALRIAAACDGRGAVSLFDLHLLQFLIGDNAGQQQQVAEWSLGLLGAAESVDPQRLARVVDAFEKQIDLEAGATELAFDDSGKLSLMQGLGGASEEQVAAAAPRMSAFSRRKRFSASHIGARIAQIDAVLAETHALVEQGIQHRKMLIEQLGSSLWASPQLLVRMVSTLDENQEKIAVQCRHLEQVRAAYSSLPLAEQDDGQVPAPVGVHG